MPLQASRPLEANPVLEYRPATLQRSQRSLIFYATRSPQRLKADPLYYWAAQGMNSASEKLIMDYEHACNSSSCVGLYYNTTVSTCRRGRRLHVRCSQAVPTRPVGRLGQALRDSASSLDVHTRATTQAHCAQNGFTGKTSIVAGKPFGFKCTAADCVAARPALLETQLQPVRKSAPVCMRAHACVYETCATLGPRHTGEEGVSIGPQNMQRAEAALNGHVVETRAGVLLCSCLPSCTRCCTTAVSAH